MSGKKKTESESNEKEAVDATRAERHADDEPEISEEYVSKGASEVTDEDVKKVVEEGEHILEFVIRIPEFKAVVNEVKVLISMVKDYWFGRYTAIPRAKIAIIAFCLLYLLNPIDIIPDFLPGIGFLDDLAIVLLCLRIIRSEMDKYTLWVEAQKAEIQAEE